MLSVVVIGRNDSHGYNLNKRVASSLNNIAHCLTDDDEIIFVDWNTPSEYPVLPVSIQDDLTHKARKLLKVIRVSQAQHKKYAGDSKRHVIEPIARNVGIRRTNPKNEWILSTNTDMLFLMEEGGLGKLVSTLGVGLWLSFRNELPEYLWDSLDKRNPNQTIQKILEWDRKFSLGKKITITPFKDTNLTITDGVGDFQLARREDWLSIKGFCETMLHGWHVDTRATIKFSKLGLGIVNILSDEQIISFHQNHSRTPTGYHGKSKTNSRFEALLDYENIDSWGLVNEELTIDEFEKLAAISFIKNVEIQNKVNIDILSIEKIHLDTKYFTEHVMNFLIDILIVLPRKSRIYVSVENQLQKLIKDYCDKFDLNVVDIDACQRNNVDLAILDLGYPYNNLPSNNLLPINNLEALKNGLPDIGGPDTIYVFVRAPNWATRKLTRIFFNTQLFNNYSQILSGRRSKRNKFGVYHKILVAILFKISLQDYRSARASSLSQIFSKMPMSIKNILVKSLEYFTGV